MLSDAAAFAPDELSCSTAALEANRPLCLLVPAQVVTVPYGTAFDHLRVADEVHFKFERCLKALGPQVRTEIKQTAVACVR